MTPLILVPGLLCDDELWQAQVRSLGAGREVLVSDTTRCDGSIDDMAERLLARAPPRFALAGLSMGGYVAMAVLRRSPQRVERLALLDTTARADSPEQTRFRHSLIGQAEADGFDQVLDALLPLFLGERTGDPDLAGRVRQMAVRVGPSRFVQQQQAIMGRPDARPELARIDCPTLVLCGQQDRLTPPAQAQEIAAGIPRAYLRLLADCGHLSTMEQPAAVDQALAEWLELSR